LFLEPACLPIYFYWSKRKKPDKIELFVVRMTGLEPTCATSAYKNLKLLLGSNPKPRWVLITLINIYDEPESSQANKSTVVTLPEASASANSATSAYLTLLNATYILYHITRTLSILFRSFFDKNAKK